MGIFSSLVNLLQPQQSKNIEKEPIRSLPTIKPDKDLFICYDEIFFIEMKNVQGISLDNIKEIHTIIKNGDGGFLNMHSYHKNVYEQFFKNKNWVWVEYENWNDICKKLGKYPSSFPVKNTIKDNSINLEYILNSLKVAELKEILKTEKVEYQEKFKKNELIDTVKKIINIENNKIIIDKLKEKEEVEKFHLYELLMRTIHFRASNYYDEKRGKRAGIKKYELTYVYEEDKEFVKLALIKNPNAIPPFFPSDLTLRTAIIDFD